ncbi:hypothetical protein FOMPIDRAFT_1132780, partial [Fomitopsis schrenkii]
MSPEGPRSGPRPLWIVVAGKRTPTANNNLNHTPNHGTRTTNGTHLHLARDWNVYPANETAQDGRVEHGGRATSEDAPAYQASRTSSETNENPGTALKPPGKQTEPQRRGRKTKAAIKIGTLNLNGRGNISATVSKWSAVNQLLREERIGILAIQETHLSEEDICSIHDLYGRRINIVNSPDPTNPTSSKGVAIILNRELVDTSSTKSTVIIPGRAILVSTNWHAGKSLTLLNVYAPNATPDNEAFWESIERKFTTGNLRKPDIIAGDFNIVEEAIDRLPMRESPPAPLAALKSLLTALKVNDGWRLANESAKEYSYPQRGGPHRSRLDRIYVSDDLLQRSLTWEISVTGVQTDHCLATTQLTSAQSPHIGKGRWAMPVHLLLDQEFIKNVISLGETELKAAEDYCERPNRTDRMNPQIILKRFKTQVQEMARKHLKRKIPKLKAKI